MTASSAGHRVPMDTVLKGAASTVDDIARQLHLEEMLADFQRSSCRAYWDGVAAAARGIRKDQNPYPEYSGGAEFWAAGYTGPDRPITPR